MSDVQNLLLCGQPGSGKTTIAKAIADNYKKVVMIDGDMLRLASANVDYSKEGRLKNMDNAIMVAKVLNANGYSTVLAIVAPYHEMRSRLSDGLPNLKIAYLKYDRKKEHRPRQEFWVKDFDLGQFDIECNTGKESVEQTYHKVNMLWLQQ